MPRGATKPRAIAHAFTAWFTAPAPMARILGNCPELTARAIIEPTLCGLLLPDTFKKSSMFAFNS